MTRTRKILLAEDDPTVCDLIEEFLGDMSVIIVVTTTRAATRKALAENSDFDLILIDFWLADGDATEVLDYLKEAYAGTPVIAMSGSDGPIDLERTEAITELSGSTIFMQKPLSRETLRQKVEQSLNNTS